MNATDPRQTFGATVLALSLALAACATEGKENVSKEGPSTTTSTTTTTTTVAKGPVEVGRWTGTANTDTANFTVTESWELHWKIDKGKSGMGIGVGVTWTDPTDQFGGDSINMNPGEDSTLIREGGTFYLEITTFGSGYEIWAVDIPN